MNIGWPPKLAHFCTPYNFIKYRLIFKLFHCQNQEKIRNHIITKDPTPPQVSLHYTLWNMCLKSSNWKQEDFCIL